MINTELMWMFLVPVLFSVIGFFVIPKLSNGDVESPQAAIIMGIALLISCLALSIAFYVGKGSKTGDTEIWNGQITSKARDLYLDFQIAQIDRQLAIEHQKVAYYEKRLARG